MEHSGKAVSGKFPVSADSTELNSGTTRTQPEKSAILICSFFFFFFSPVSSGLVCLCCFFFPTGNYLCKQHKTKLNLFISSL